jgi:hypothetical protein
MRSAMVILLLIAASLAACGGMPRVPECRGKLESINVIEDSEATDGARRRT